MYDMTAIGNAPVDVLVNVSEEFITNHSLNKGDWQEVSAEKFEVVTRECTIDSLQSGGSIANTAWTMAELGQKIAFIGHIGADKTGRQFYNDMQKAGITMDKPDVSAKTMNIYVLITPDGQRTFVSRGVTAPIIPANIDENFIKESKWLLIEGYLMMDQMEAVDQAILLARKHNVKIALTLSAPFVVENCFDNIATEVLKGMDLIIANDEEMDDFIRTAEGRSHKEAVQLTRKIIASPRVITYGGQGASYVDKYNRVTAPCTHIENPTDTTGAGDAFAAGFMYVYIDNPDDIDKALGLGHLLAHSVINQVGGRLHLVDDNHKDFSRKTA